MTWREQLETDGFALLRGVFTPEAVAGIVAEWNEVTQRYATDDAMLSSEGGLAYGARNLLDLWPRVAELARAPGLRDAVTEILGSGAGVVRALYFDKPPGHSWALPWHKDYSVAVTEHGRIGLFTKPTVKAGVPHLTAPFAVLSRMLTLRIHLDDVTADNGPLRVIPGSHRFYHQQDDEPREALTIYSRAGDVLLMRPLLTHASGHSKPEAESHRRIVHLECAADVELPEGYRWKWFRELGEPRP